MSCPLYWPGKYFLYAIGNTSAVCLTRDLPPEQDADMLLLGCGDPRHVLYTIFSESDGCELFYVYVLHLADLGHIASRKLAFTCVDYEPGVLGEWPRLPFTLFHC